ncbi:MAG: S41 family peptidase [Mucilaginibacter sp.]
MKKNCLLLLFVVFTTPIIAQTKQQIENQVAFTKLYGYVRYFHPSDEAAAIDWDKFAIYGSKKVAECNDQQQLKQTLINLFSPIAPTLQIGNQDENISFDKEKLIPPTPLDGYKTIAWQHIGVGLLNDKRSPYQSARTNRNVNFKPISQSFGTIAKFFDAKPYRGKQFKLEGKAKMVTGTGSGHFWARVDLNNTKTGFFNNMDESPIVSTEWKNYVVTGTIDSNAVDLATGTFLSGNGEFWVDNYKISIKEGTVWKEVYSNTFNTQKTGVSITGIFGNAPLKVPNPNYAFSIVEDNKTPAEKWVSIKSTLPTNQITEKHTSYFKAYPAVGEYIAKDIGANLKVIIPLAVYGNSTNTYPIADTLKLAQLKSNYNKINDEDITGVDLYTRLGDLCITWNVFQHFFLYFDFAQTNWLDDMREAISEAYVDSTRYAFQKNLQKLTAKLKDGHIRVNITGGSNYNYVPPIAWEWIEGKLVITDVSGASFRLKKGDIVTAINGLNPQDYFKAVEQNISAATDGWLKYRAQIESLAGEKDTELRLDILDNDGKNEKVVLRRTLSFNEHLSTSPKDEIKILGKDIMYVNIGAANMNTINSSLVKLQNSKTIICDLRGYPKNNNNFIEYLLTQKDTASNWLQIPHIIYPDREKLVEFKKGGWNLKPRKPHLNAKIIFLIDGQAISWAESYMGIIEHYKLATIIGQPTAGTNGDINQLSLPGGYTITFTGLKVVKLDGSQHHGIGTRPDIYVTKTIKGVRENRDEFLEKALEIANE